MNKRLLVDRQLHLPTAQNITAAIENMKIILLCMLLFTGGSVFAQYLVLKGHLICCDNAQKGNIYYSINEKGFNKRHFIRYDKTTGYQFKISIEKIRKENIKTLNFSTEVLQDTKSTDACIHKIRVDAILKDTAFINKKSIEITTDLSPDTYCEETVLSGAFAEGNGRFVGEYNFINNGKNRSVRLEDGFYEYKASINFQNEKFYREEAGYWEYNKEKNLLIIHVQYLQNEKFGLLLFDTASYEFTVNEQAGKLQFTGKQGSLVKN
jgi:hypothetical protein